LNRRQFIFVVTTAAVFLFIIVFCSILFTCRIKTLKQANEHEEYLLPVTEQTEFYIQEEEIPVKTEESLNYAGFNEIRVSYHVQRPLSSLAGLGRHSGLGVIVAEIDPINYKNPNIDILRQMGVDQYIISFLEGEKFYQNADYDRALAAYTVSISRNAEFAEALVSRGNTWMKKRDFSRAIDDYSRAIRLESGRAELYNYRGFARSERNEMFLAIEDFSRAITLDRNYVDALINRSHAYYQTGDFVKAIEDCNQIIALEPSNAVIWNRRGSAWYRREDDDRAIRDFTEAIRLRSDYATAFFNRGNAWYNKGELDKALADLNRCLAINPSFAGAHASRENILRLLNTR
jgi:tetratricopeptide (TPR) repeat protein